MIYLGKQALWQSTRRELRAPTGDFYKGMWMDSGDDPVQSPTVFLVEMPPHLVANPHFHRNNQFQVFLQGSGSIGAHTVTPVTVHYAGAYTGYGPLKASEEGLSYFTMRPVQETGAQYLPESRDQMVRGPKRQATGNVSRLSGADELKQRAVMDREVIIPTSEDKLAAHVLRIPPDTTFTGTDPTGSDGQFFIVLSGSMQWRDELLRPWEHLYVSADETGFAASAGAEGLEVLFLQFPLKAHEYQRAQ